MEVRVRPPMCSAHSPLVMSSVESVFDDRQDVWFDLDLVGDKVTLTER